MKDETKNPQEEVKNEATNTPATETKETAKADETKKAEQPAEKELLPQWREILITTDGNSIKLVKNQTAGTLELISILSSIVNSIQSQSKK